MKNLKGRMCSLLASLAVLACCMPGAANAAGLTVFDNGGPDNVSGNNMGFAWQAEDFSIGPSGPITGLSFWSLEAAGAYRGSISWAIVSSLGGDPIASGTETLVQRTNTGLDQYRNDLSFATPLDLAAGSYWLILHNGSFSNMGDPNEFLWATSAANGTLEGMESYDGGITWTSNYNQHAFLISAVPEPGPVAMLAAGLLVFGFLRRREQQSAPFVR